MATEPPPRWKVIGPGLVVAATGVGAADLVATLVAGSRYAYTLLWVVVLGTVLKVILVEGAARYSLATGRTIFEGWRAVGRWTTWYFAPYIVVWGFVYGASAMSSSALPIVALLPGLPLRGVAIASCLLGLALVWFGSYAAFEKVMVALVGLMFAAVVSAAVRTLPNLPEIAGGLVPTIPDGSLLYILGIAGGVGGTITLAAYGYWLREKGWDTPRFMKVMRLDNGVAYAVTGLFVICTLVIGAELLYARQIALSAGDQGLVDLSAVLEARYGVVFRVIFLLGFWAASMSSLVGVWSGVSLMFGDFLGTLRGLPPGDPRTRIGGSYVRAYTLWLTFPPMVLLLLDRPVALIYAYGMLGAVFMPFLAVTLLVLLNRRDLGTWRNGSVSNALLGLCALLFAALAINEVRGVLGAR